VETIGFPPASTTAGTEVAGFGAKTGVVSMGFSTSPSSVPLDGFGAAGALAETVGLFCDCGTIFW
jgi:hypothetical protein